MSENLSDQDDSLFTMSDHEIRITWQKASEHCDNLWLLVSFRDELGRWQLSSSNYLTRITFSDYSYQLLASVSLRAICLWKSRESVEGFDTSLKLLSWVSADNFVSGIPELEL